MALFRRALGVRSEFQKGTLDVAQAFFDEVNFPLTTPCQLSPISSHSLHILLARYKDTLLWLWGLLASTS